MDFIKANFKKEELITIIDLYFKKYKNLKIKDLGGVANNNYRFTTDLSDIVVKAYSHGQSDYLKIEKELKAIKQFSNAGVLIPKIISGLDGKEIQNYKGFNIVATEFIEGKTYDKLKFTDQRMLEVGKITGQIVLSARKILNDSFECMSLLEEFDYVSENLEEIIRKRKFVFDLKTYKENLPLIKEIITKLDSSNNKHFLHKDIWPYNLIEGNSGAYLIDFNDWAIGPEIIEVAVPILEFGMFKSNNLSINIVKNIVTGFKSILAFDYLHKDIWEAVLSMCYLFFSYNVIQADTPFESEIYLKRIGTLIEDPDIFSFYENL